MTARHFWRVADAQLGDFPWWRAWRGGHWELADVGSLGASVLVWYRMTRCYRFGDRHWISNVVECEDR